MVATRSRIERRQLVKLAGWGMTGLRPPGRGNLHKESVSAPRAVPPVANEAVQPAGASARQEQVSAA